MNAFIRLFKQLIFPHLWANHNITPGMGAAIGGIAGGLGSVFGGGDEETEMQMPGWMEDSSRQFYDRLAKGEFSGSPGFWESYNPQMYEGDLTAKVPDWLKQEYKQYARSSDKPGSGFGRAQDYYQDVLKGDYLGLNPAMQSAVMNPAIDNVASRFAAAGRGGYNPANVQSQNSSAMAALMPFYNQERNRQGQAAEMLPQMDDWAMGRKQAFGDVQMQNRQANINREMYQNEFQNNKWLDRMQNFQGLLGSMGSGGGGIGTQTSSLSPGNWLSAGLGGAYMGSQFANNLGSASTTPSNYDMTVPMQPAGGNGAQAFTGLGTNGANAMGPYASGYGAMWPGASI